MNEDKKKPKQVTKKSKKEVEEIVEINPILKEDVPEEIVEIKEKSKFCFVNIAHEFKTIEVVLLVFIAIVIGMCIGGLVVSLNLSDKVIKTEIAATEDENLNKFIKTYDFMLDKYIEETDATTLINGAIEGMLNSVDDPYTSYFNAEQTTSFYKRLKGIFFGIGCELVSDDTNVYITRVLPNSPAEKAGIKAWDIITEVNGISAVSKTANEVVTIIEQSKTTEITLLIKRETESKTFKVTKADVIIPSVRPKVYNQNNQKIGYLKIDLYAENTYIQFKEELEKLEVLGIESLIIDVRGNSGGYLSVVDEIISLFLPKNKVIYQLKSKDNVVKRFSLSDDKRNYSIVVLQDQGSASGSEILASAIKEVYNGEVIGTNSFGKSSVQQAADLGDGTMIKYTVQKWLTAKGNDVADGGLKPTIKVELNEQYFKQPNEANDNQLQKALETLSK